LAKSWLIDFNPNKHESVTFSRKYKRSTPWLNNERHFKSIQIYFKNI
jgi:hypothetical protein